MLVAVVFAVVFTGEPPPAGEVPCDLVKVRTEERRLGLAPSAGEADPGDATAGSEMSALQFLTLRCKGRQYVARFVGDRPKVEAESKPSVLTVRFEGEKIFIKGLGGKEIEARYATVGTPRAAKPGTPAKK